MKHPLLLTIFFFASVCSAYGAPFRDEGIIAEAPADAYAGSARCGECHTEQYETWSKTLKARFVRYSKDVDQLPGAWDESPLEKRAVFLVVGLKSRAAFIDADWAVLPAEYNLDAKRWIANGKRGGRDYRQRCGACHLTGCNPQEKRFTELGVGCEACHGPGGKHAEMDSHAFISTPGKDGGEVLATCRRCHNSRNNHADAIRTFNGAYHGK